MSPRFGVAQFKVLVVCPYHSIACFVDLQNLSGIGYRVIRQFIVDVIVGRPLGAERTVTIVNRSQNSLM